MGDSPKPAAQLLAGGEPTLGPDPTSISVTLNTSSTVFIGDGCSGLELFILFAGFVLIIGGAWRMKAWFLPLGLLTGLLGINVGGIPGAESPLGFAIVCGLLVGLGAVQVWSLSRSGWL